MARKLSNIALWWVEVFRQLKVPQFFISLHFFTYAATEFFDQNS